MIPVTLRVTYDDAIKLVADDGTIATLNQCHLRGRRDTNEVEATAKHLAACWNAMCGVIDPETYVQRLKKSLRSDATVFASICNMIDEAVNEKIRTGRMPNTANLLQTILDTARMQNEETSAILLTAAFTVSCGEKTQYSPQHQMKKRRGIR